MAAYATVLVNDIRDPQRLGRYREAVVPLVERYGGAILAADFNPTAVEGQGPAAVVLLRFPNAERIRAWYEADEYAPLKAERMQSGDFSVLFVAGQ